MLKFYQDMLKLLIICSNFCRLCSSFCRIGANFTIYAQVYNFHKKNKLPTNVLAGSLFLQLYLLCFLSFLSLSSNHFGM